MTTAHRLTDGRSSGYGCGEGVNDRGPAVTLSHGGAVSGFVAQNTVIPVDEIGGRAAVEHRLRGDRRAESGAGRVSSCRRSTYRSFTVATALEAAQAFLVGAGEGNGRSLDARRGLQRLSHAGESVRGESGAERARPDLEHSRRSARASAAEWRSTSILFDVGQTTARALMYRAPSGKIEEFLISRN